MTRRQPGFWNLETIIHELKKIVVQKKLKTFPTKTQLIEMGRSDITGAINYHEISYKTLETKFESEGIVQKKVMSELDRKPDGYWRSLENTIFETRALMKRLGTTDFPSKKQIIENGSGSIIYAISHYHGGMFKFRQLLGLALSRQPPGHWTIDNIISKLCEIMNVNQLHVMPGAHLLRKYGYGDIVNAIKKHHNGFKKFRKKVGKILNSKLKSTEPGIWKNFEYAKSEAYKAMKKLGVETLPGSKTLREAGYGPLLSGIMIYHNGMRSFRKKIGLDQIRIQDGLRADFKYVKNEVKKIIKLHDLDHFPTAREFEKLGYSSISSAITDFHGGFNKMKSALGYEEGSKRRGFWKNKENVFNETKKMMDENKLISFPSARKFQELGHSTIVAAIFQYHGGLSEFRSYYEQRVNIPSEKQQLENLLNNYSEDKP